MTRKVVQTERARERYVELKHILEDRRFCLRADTDDGSPTGRLSVIRPKVRAAAAPELGAALIAGSTLTGQIDGPGDRERLVD